MCVATLVRGARGVVSLVKSMVDEVVNHSVVVKIVAVINFLPTTLPGAYWDGLASQTNSLVAKQLSYIHASHA